ncbi:hypothetical protein C2S51_010406 [Perilla frutescens var. frutescens]|nr:hypothetical protein C2S51_010406 [Perilla frutescens var. frutescens]
MEKKYLNPIYKALVIAYHLLLHYSDIVGAATKGGVPPGQWQVLLNNTGVVAMHMALTHYGTVIMFDQTGSGPSNYRLHHRYNGRRCRAAREDLRDPSCYAHSVEYNLSENRIRPLFIEPDPWGSSGSFLSNGTLLEIGGFGGPGSKRIRYFRPCAKGNCDWMQGRRHLSDARWYASSLRLPDHNDRVVVVGGRDVSSYEFVPKRSLEEKSFDLPFLKRTSESDERGSNLYPILHLSPDGNIFIFANKDSILFNYKHNKVVKTFPRIPGKGSRTYPSSGSSVLLPLDHDNGFQKAEVMICGGAADGAVQAAREGRFLRGLDTCGRIVITGNNVHKWKMEKMPGARLLHDMIILPNGNVLIINGAESGCAGSNSAAHPAFQPYLYKPKKQFGSRFSLLKPTKVARMYHSSAVLAPDGRILVAGSNPNNNYAFGNVAHPTELRLQAFTPANMEKEFDDRRPSNVTVVNHDGGVAYGGKFSVGFLLRKRAWHSAHDAVFTAYAAPFNTHSISMNQRLLVLRSKNVTMAAAAGERWLISAEVEAPPSAKVAPAGFYMISVVYNGIPSRSQWVRFMHK